MPLFSNDPVSMLRLPPAVGLLVWGGLGILLGSAVGCTGPQSTTDEEQPARVYHVQVRMTEDKAEAERALGAVLDWWDESVPGNLPRPLETERGSPVDIAYRPPLYRVRLGPFASREEAETVLAAARESYPEAFVVPGRRSASGASP